MPTFQTTIELPLLVEYTVDPASPGSRDSFGAPLEPDSPAEIELLQASLTSPALPGVPLLFLHALDHPELRRLTREATRHAGALAADARLTSTQSRRSPW